MRLLLLLLAIFLLFEISNTSSDVFRETETGELMGLTNAH